MPTLITQAKPNKYEIYKVKTMQYICPLGVYWWGAVSDTMLEGNNAFRYLSMLLNKCLIHTVLHIPSAKGGSSMEILT